MQSLKAAISQLLALAGVWLALRLWPEIVGARWAPALQAAIAAALSRLLRQPLWWLPIHLLFFPAVLFAASLQLPAWAYLGAGLLLALVFWGTAGGDVPLFYPRRPSLQPYGTLRRGNGLSRLSTSAPASPAWRRLWPQPCPNCG